jgi:hypothetical protein
MVDDVRIELLAEVGLIWKTPLVSSEPENEILTRTPSNIKYWTSRSTYRQEKTQYGTLHGID